MDARVEFVAADMPTANKLTIHIFAAMAEYERDAISQRTKAALAAARDRGAKLGNPKAHLVSELGVRAIKRAADEFANRVHPTIQALRASGHSTYAALSLAMNASGIRTQRGREWTPMGVRNVVLRVQEMRSTKRDLRA
jgi:DNA invertase Pin-like site-specific DNA recombinase